MAKTFGIEITGIEEMVADLQALPKTIVTKCFGQALAAAERVITPAVKAATPVDKALLATHRIAPGALRAAVESRVEVDTGARGGQVTVDWGDLSHIAGFVEYGHRQVTGGYSHVDKSGRTHGPGREVGQVPPHPFARPVMARISEEAVEAFATGLGEAIEEAGEL